MNCIDGLQARVNAAMKALPRPGHAAARDEHKSKVVYTPKTCRYQVQRSDDGESWRVYEAHSTLDDACYSADMNANMFPTSQWRVVDTEED